MKRWKLPLWAAAVTLATSSTLAAASASPPRWHRVALHTKAQAEQNVLRALPQRSAHNRLRALLDQRTGLLRNNVQVVCRGRGVLFSEGSYHRFTCVARVHEHRGHALSLSYLARSSGRFRIKILAAARR
jgi:hypothetical protein